MYKPKYNYKNTMFEEMPKILNNLYDASQLEFFSNSNNEFNHFERKKYAKDIKEFISCIEDYIYGLQLLKYLNYKTSKMLIEQIKKIPSITPIIDERNRIHGVTHADYSIEIQHYPNYIDRLCIFHELNHITHKTWKRDIDEYIDSVIDKYKEDAMINENFRKTIFSIKEGFNFLDEITSQELAEEIHYALKNKKRPKYKFHRDENIFNGKKYKSRLDCYCEFEEPAIIFGKIFEKIQGKNSHAEDIMKKLAISSLNKDFIANIVKVFKRDEKDAENLLVILICLGRIKDASYQKFGKNKFKTSMQKSSDFYQLLNDTLNGYEVNEPIKIKKKGKPSLLN